MLDCGKECNWTLVFSNLYLPLALRPLRVLIGQALLDPLDSYESPDTSPNERNTPSELQVKSVNKIRIVTIQGTYHIGHISVHGKDDSGCCGSNCQ
jgi:hypothetical protein